MGPAGVLEDAHTFHRDQRPARNHLVQDGKQTVNVRLIVNHFDHHRQIRRQLNQAGGVNDTVRAEARDTMCTTVAPATPSARKRSKSARASGV